MKKIEQQQQIITEQSHIENCCIFHGCKYDDENCPVVKDLVIQKNPCEECHGIHPDDLGKEEHISKVFSKCGDPILFKNRKRKNKLKRVLNGEKIDDETPIECFRKNLVEYLAEKIHEKYCDWVKEIICKGSGGETNSCEMDLERNVVLRIPEKDFDEMTENLYKFLNKTKEEYIQKCMNESSEFCEVLFYFLSKIG